jgi:hypothetical protein
MSVPVLTFFNNTGALAPLANLTAAFLDEDQLANLWTEGAGASTIYRSVKPGEFRHSVLAEAATAAPTIENDHYCLAMLRRYNSLMPLAQEARKPIFSLRSADGAIGSHASAVAKAHADFVALARDIARRIGVVMPENA